MCFRAQLVGAEARIFFNLFFEELVELSGVGAQIDVVASGL